MILKRSAILALILGVGLMIIGLLMPLLFMGNETQHGGSVGIIGGAGTPTYLFMLSNLLNGLPYVFVLFGISTAIASGFCLLFSKTVCAYCNIKYTAVSLGVSFCGALGLLCFFLWYVIVSFGQISMYPIKYPASIILGLLCFVTFAALLILYFGLRKQHASIGGIVIDALTAVLYLPSFFFLFSYLLEIFG